MVTITRSAPRKPMSRATACARMRTRSWARSATREGGVDHLNERLGFGRQYWGHGYAALSGGRRYLFTAMTAWRSIGSRLGRLGETWLPIDMRLFGRLSLPPPTDPEI